MTAYTLTKTRLTAGTYEGVLTGARPDTPPALTLTHQSMPIAGLEVIPLAEPGHFGVRAPIPADLISDGVQTFVIADAETGATLDSFAILAGEALSEDIRAEMELLRAELDMLKRAFRRHCIETAA